MTTLEILWMIGLAVGFFSIIPPLATYSKAVSRNTILSRPEIDQSYPKITIFLPIRNESLVIEEKIREILESNYPTSRMEILIIDSSSDDNSVSIAEGILREEVGHNGWKILIAKELGKSYAVKMALEIIDTEIFVMMDSDARSNSDSIEKIIAWFQDESIGGVCGSKSEFNDIEVAYRSRFNSLRKWESFIDSTPIFEGSICAFRISSFDGLIPDVRINADDSQMAINSRRNGFRAIMDHEITFTEPINHHRPLYRKIRRAQGLSRTFWKNRDMCYLPMEKFSWIFRSNFYFHILFPWLFMLSFSIMAASSIADNYRDAEISINIFDIFIISSILMPLNKTIRIFLVGIVSLTISHVLILGGKRLNVWNPRRINSPEN